jgi:hypothetical protein
VSLSLLAMIFLNEPSDAVDKVRLSLEASSACWFAWVKYAGYAVAVGCAMEAPETFVTIKRWWLLTFRDEEKEETKKEKKSWILPLAAVGLIIIVVGILIETFAEAKVSDVDAQIRSHESDKISAAENNAAAAIREAGNAKDSAKEAAGSSALAKGSAVNATTLATGARKEADSFEADIVAAKKESARLKEELADRTLTDAQQATIADKLRDLPSQEYQVTAYWDSQESLGIANRIHQALLSSNWKFNPDGAKSMMLGGIVGVQVWHHPAADESTKEAAKLLIDLLNGVGIAAYEKEQNPENPKTNMINVNVGSKR